MKRIAAFVVLVTLLAVAAGCQNTVSSTQLNVGDCFNYVNTTDANGDPINLPSPIDCAKAHSDEVFGVFDYLNASSAWPGYEAIGAIRQTQCQNEFQTYVGVSWDRSQLTIAYISPDEQSWASGDRAIQCLLEDASGGQLTGSARGSKK